MGTRTILGRGTSSNTSSSQRRCRRCRGFFVVVWKWRMWGEMDQASTAFVTTSNVICLCRGITMTIFGDFAILSLSCRNEEYAAWCVSTCGSDITTSNIHFCCDMNCNMKSSHWWCYRCRRFFVVMRKWIICSKLPWHTCTCVTWYILTANCRHSFCLSHSLITISRNPRSAGNDNPQLCEWILVWLSKWVGCWEMSRSTLTTHSLVHQYDTRIGCGGRDVLKGNSHSWIVLYRLNMCTSFNGKT